MLARNPFFPGNSPQLTISLALSRSRYRYIPDISRSLMVVLEKMLDAAEAAGSSSSSSSSDEGSNKSLKRARLLQDVESGALTEDRVEASLNQAVARMEAESALQAMADDAAGGKRVRLFLAINPLTLPDPLPPKQPTSAAAAAAAAAAAVSSSAGGVIDLSGDSDAMDVDAAVGKLISDRGDTEYKDIKCGKPGARIWVV